MGIAEEYVKKSKTPITYVKITKFLADETPSVDAQGDDYYPQVISCEITQGFDQGSSTCSLTIKNVTDENGTTVRFVPMNRVCVQEGWNSVGTLRTRFFGFIDKVQYSNPPETVRLECRDILKLAQDNYLVESNKRVYYSGLDEDELDDSGDPTGGQAAVDRTPQAIITDLMVDSGIPESRLFLDFVDYPASGSIVMASNYPAVFKYESAFDAVMRICDLLGYRLWADASGNVQCREVRAIASSTASQTYQSQVETYDNDGTWTVVTQGNLINIDVSKDDDLRNWVKVIYSDDPNVASTVAGDSDYVPTPPQYRRTEIRSFLLDTQELVDAVALRTYTDLNRLRYTAQATIEGDPRIDIGQTIELNDPFSMESSMNFFLYGWTSNFRAGSYTMELTLVGGVGEGSEPVSNISPVALFTSTVERETLANGTFIADVIVDASSSYDPDGPSENLTYRWVCSGFADAYSVRNYYTYSGTDATYLTVTLYVTDNGSPPLSDSLTQSVAVEPGEQMQWKNLYVASGKYVYSSTTGGISWTVKELW